MKRRRTVSHRPPSLVTPSRPGVEREAGKDGVQYLAQGAAELHRRAVANDEIVEAALLRRAREEGGGDALVGERAIDVLPCTIFDRDRRGAAGGRIARATLLADEDIRVFVAEGVGADRDDQALAALLGREARGVDRAAIIGESARGDIPRGGILDGELALRVDIHLGLSGGRGDGRGSRSTGRDGAASEMPGKDDRAAPQQRDQHDPRDEAEEQIAAITRRRG